MRRSNAPSRRLLQGVPLTKPPEATADFQRQTNSGILETVKQNAIVLQPESKAIYKVIYGKRTTKKNKTFQDDGTLEIVANDAILKDNNGKQVTTVTHKWSQIEDGEQLLIGSYEMEIVEHIAGPKINFQIKEQAVDIISTSKDRENINLKNNAHFKQIQPNNPVSKPNDDTATQSSPDDNDRLIFNVVWGKCSTKKHKTFDFDGTLEISEKFVFLKNADGRQISSTARRWTVIEPGMEVIIGSNEVQINEQISGKSANACPSSSSSDNQTQSIEFFQQSKRQKTTTSNTTETICSTSVDSHKTPIRKTSSRKIEKLTVNIEYEPLILPRPNELHQLEFNTLNVPIKDVTVMGSLTRQLRPHQREGIIFMYECLMGFKSLNNTPCYGCILADEMGLGKTLQCITVCYTLLKQSPYGGSVANKILIVTPSSLVDNWVKEIRKWLGRERAFIFQIDNKNRPEQFARTNHIPFLIISYEMLAKTYDELSSVRFDVIVCDEGHRLKNCNIKVSQCLEKFPCKRRIILSGTPIQNDLREFYSLINFVTPGILGEYTAYKRKFETPILQSQQPNASKMARELGTSRSEELSDITKLFVLRRTQEINNKYLKGKREYVVFCRPSELQQELLVETLKYYQNNTSSHGQGSITPFHVITTLKKICNHPCLIRQSSSNNVLTDYLEKFLLPPDQMTIYDSGKLAIVRGLLDELIHRKEKIVLVSYYTKTLDLMQGMLDHFQFKYCRLDGSTQASGRMQLVERFNDKNNDTFVFLLSAKAGGVGLNLIGASRLVLFDNDWNPSSDLQAMSRIWRDGQKKVVHIYRLIINSSIEEKIFQRQISKTSLSSCVVDQRNQDSNPKLSDVELKDLFTIPNNFDGCSTHDLLHCSCAKQGISPVADESAPSQRTEVSIKMNELMLWEHFDAPANETNLLTDMCLNSSADDIVFIFRNSCN